jgi:tetratricopeptide (TPR) repeat protein
VFCLVARRLLAAAMPAAGVPAVWMGAAAASLFFALHPLRAESVAWVTERRDVLSGLFVLLAALAYLVAHAEGQSRTRHWLLVSVGAFALAGLAKAIVVTLPVVLLVLDVYPLRRIEARAGAWRTPEGRRLLVDKLPYLVLALFIGAMQVYAQVANRYLTTFDTLPLIDRVPVAFYSVWFYVVTTLVPVGLSPLYELPARVNPLEPRFLLASVGTLALTGAAVALRRRWPAGLAAWLAYVLMILPVSGLLHNGHQLAHDRYSYLSCLPWAVIFGAALAAGISAVRRGTVRPSVGGLAVGALALWLVGLSTLTWHQVAVWRDNDTLWRYALEADGECAICHSNLGVSLFNRRLMEPAIERFERSIALRPDRVRTQGNLGLALMASGRAAEAVPRFERVLARYPTDSETRVNLAVALLQGNRHGEAIAHLEQVLEREPRHALALTNLGSALLDRGDPAAAAHHLERAADIKPDMPQARVGLVKTYVALGRPDAAAEQLEILRALDPSIARQIGPGLITVW